MTTYQNIAATLPASIKDALHDAMEISIENIPAIEGQVCIGVDTSGSMKSPVTGHRAGATTVTKCVDVAALIASCILRKNKSAIILPFDTSLHLTEKLEPRDTVMTNAAKLAKFGGGGTAVSLPVIWARDNKPDLDVMVIISDNESWIDRGYSGGTSTQQAWTDIKRKNKKAKLVCIDIQSTTTSQVDSSRPDILHIAGWSDKVFIVVAEWLKSGLNGKPTTEALVKEIEQISILSPAKVIEEPSDVQEAPQE
jgi:60 kDa SS-A/Ro ribonucleoprotein